MGILPVVVGSYEELETTKAVNEKLDEKDKLCIDGNPPIDEKKCPEGQYLWLSERFNANIYSGEGRVLNIFYLNSYSRKTGVSALCNPS